MEDSDYSNNSNASCYEFTAKQIYYVTVAVSVVSSVGVAACLLVVIIILVLKQYKKFVNRLVLYLIIATCMHAVSNGLEVAPVHHMGRKVVVRRGLNGLCAAVGFITQTTAWMFFMVLLWIVFYLFFLAVFKFGANKIKHEITGILLSILFPLSFNWVPFIQHMYGLSGIWCWIRLTKGDCRHDYTQGIIYQFSLFYGPLTLLIFISFISFVIIVCVLCWQRTHARGINVHHSSYHQAVQEALPLLIYPLIYDVLCTLMTANRIYYAITDHQGKDPYFPLWFIQSIIDPSRTLVPPLAFILHPNTLRKICCSCKKRKEQDNIAPSTTVYVVSKECPYTEVDPLIIRASNCYNEGVQSLFEGKD